MNKSRGMVIMVIGRNDCQWKFSIECSIVESLNLNVVSLFAIYKIYYLLKTATLFFARRQSPQ